MIRIQNWIPWWIVSNDWPYIQGHQTIIIFCIICYTYVHTHMHTHVYTHMCIHTQTPAVHHRYDWSKIQLDLSTHGVFIWSSTNEGNHCLGIHLYKHVQLITSHNWETVRTIAIKCEFLLRYTFCFPPNWLVALMTSSLHLAWPGLLIKG